LVEYRPRGKRVIGEGLKKSIKRYSAIIEYWQNIFKELNTLPVFPNYAEKYYF
jgi:hypothetical protein